MYIVKEDNTINVKGRDIDLKKGQKFAEGLITKSHPSSFVTEAEFAVLEAKVEAPKEIKETKPKKAPKKAKKTEAPELLVEAPVEVEVQIETEDETETEKSED